MITVRRSDTGSYVLVHEPSQTVMVGEALEPTFARMEEHLLGNPSLPTTLSPSAVTAGGPRRAWFIGVALLALLPFVWLAVLHYSLGRMLDELRASPPTPAMASEELLELRSEVEALRAVVSRVEDEVGQGRPGAPTTPLGRAAGRTRPGADAADDEDATPAEAAEPDDDDRDEGTEPGQPGQPDRPDQPDQPGRAAKPDAP